MRATAQGSLQSRSMPPRVARRWRRWCRRRRPGSPREGSLLRRSCSGRTPRAPLRARRQRSRAPGSPGVPGGGRSRLQPGRSRRREGGPASTRGPGRTAPRGVPPLGRRRGRQRREPRTALKSRKASWEKERGWPVKKECPVAFRRMLPDKNKHPCFC